MVRGNRWNSGLIEENMSRGVNSFGDRLIVQITFRCEYTLFSSMVQFMLGIWSEI